MISFHTTLTDTIELLAFKKATQNESEWKSKKCLILYNTLCTSYTIYT